MLNKRVFVSGGAGVIGLEMIPRLVGRGAIVMVGDLKPRPKDFGPEVTYRQGDLNSMTAQELASYRPDVFIHLAATFERSTESYQFWEENFWHNVRLSHHLMTIVKDIPTLCRVVFASSYLIYDPALYQFAHPQQKAASLKETDPVLPRNLTGAAKFSHEIELRFIESFRSEQFTSVCARIFRGYGRNSRDVISRWVRELLQKRPINVYRPEGIFDYVYAADTAEGLIRLAEHKQTTGIINLGTGKARRVQEVVDVLKKHFPEMVSQSIDSDISYEASEADMCRYKAEIGWSPCYTLEMAIPEIIAFEQNATSQSFEGAQRIPRVLVSSASRKIPLIRAMQHAARKIHPEAIVIAGDASEKALSRDVADEFWCMPSTTMEHLQEIIEGCKARNITAVLPTRDGELSFWAKHAEAFHAVGVTVITSSLDSVLLCVDKLAFAEFGMAHKLSFIPAAVDVDAIPASAYVVKERFGAGARAVGLNLGKEDARGHAKTLSDPIVQPHINGSEISIDAWLDRSQKVKGLVLRRRELVINGESQITTTFRDGLVEAVALTVLEALQLSGPVVLQAIMTEDHKLQIIECNARFGGASTTSVAAGLDSFYWSLLETHGVDVSEYVFARIPGEVRQVRVPSDLYFSVDDSHL
jgi:carbamoyl-phosphate synthase large subunit